MGNYVIAVGNYVIVSPSELRNCKIVDIGFTPQRLGHLVPGDVAVTVDHQVGEQQPALAAGQAGIQPLAIALDSQRPADLDPHRVRGRQGHANILALR